MPARSPIYTVKFEAEGINSVVVLLDETPANVTGGYGGWVVVSRMRRVGLTQWQGKDPLRMSIPILFDGMRDRSGVELDISRLSRMALPPKAGGEPPTVRVSGSAVPSPGPTVWVIESIQWGTAKVIYGLTSVGVSARLRQDAVVSLLEYQADDRVAFANLPLYLKNGTSKTGWPKSYVIKAGETLQSVAAKKEFYGDATKWTLIADANGLRDPTAAKVGSTLRIPAP